MVSFVLMAALCTGHQFPHPKIMRVGVRRDSIILAITYDVNPGMESSRLVPLGANCAYRREIFEKYRFDPELGPNRTTGLRGSEDTAVGMQLLRDGFRLQYRPDAVVEHPVTPQRATLDYVRCGYWVNGVETLRLQRLLGQQLPSEQQLLARANRGRRRLWRRVLDPAGNVRRQLKSEWAAGMLAELRGQGLGPP